MDNDNYIKETVAKNILFHRKKNKLSQKELAEKLNVKHNTISSWEKGTNSIDIEMLFKICNIFDVSVNTMFGIHELSIPFEHKQIISKYNELDDTAKDIVDYILNKEQTKSTTPPLQKIVTPHMYSIARGEGGVIDVETDEEQKAIMRKILQEEHEDIDY